MTPIVTYGDTLPSRITVSSAAKSLESQGYRVVAGINGDFSQHLYRIAHRPCGVGRGAFEH